MFAPQIVMSTIVKSQRYTKFAKLLIISILNIFYWVAPLLSVGFLI
jgi:hypothetical protein